MAKNEKKLATGVKNVGKGGDLIMWWMILCLCLMFVGGFLWGYFTGTNLIKRKNNKIIFDIAKKWKRHARKLFIDATYDKTAITAKQAMEHDAIIFMNCAVELAEVFKIEDENK